jgi:hypothetical protein
MLNREEILATNDLSREEVDVPGWGKLLIREMTAADRITFEEFIKPEGVFDRANFYPMLAVRTIVDQDGNRLFEDAEYPALAGKSLKALEAVAEAAMRLNGIGIQAAAEKIKN